ncbi:proline/glycine betaine ABC transporter ATP-binding protein [Floricoccus penangensis]|uniref:ABC-type quaternary amine transporter n=1 Tax=Floricoccus penangensis TaxID=1859475 RepID=A0A9Q5P0N3_9LACT|nr:ABC transporter ATP-binding protein [Floricoccus penangensis]OFI47943.1 proline/glycine betaine ABC transporter ATP-binding protein [Floricoccus penangensis]
MKNIIEFKDVNKNYDQKKALQDINLQIREGEIFVLVGPSGSGKTTSLKMINGLIPVTSGEILFKGKDIHEYDLQKMRWQMGYVLQQIALFPNMTVKENIELIPSMLKWSKEDMKDLASNLLQEVGLSPEKYLKRYPKELSGGEQQRVGIIRAIASKPDIILMDEPFSALDPISRESLQNLVLDIHKNLQTTIVFVTHNMQEALLLADRIAIMRDGQIIQCDTPENISDNPANDFVRDFFKETHRDEDGKETILQFLANRPMLAANIDDKAPRININSKMIDVFSLLSKNVIVNIEDNGKNIASLSQDLVFKYLSEK